MPGCHLFHKFAMEGLLDVGNVHGLSSNGSKVGNQGRGAGVSNRKALPLAPLLPPFLMLQHREAALMVVSVKMNEIPEQAIKEVEHSLPWKIISLE